MLLRDMTDKAPRKGKKKKTSTVSRSSGVSISFVFDCTPGKGSAVLTGSPCQAATSSFFGCEARAGGASALAGAAQGHTWRFPSLGMDRPIMPGIRLFRSILAGKAARVQIS